MVYLIALSAKFPIIMIGMTKIYYKQSRKVLLYQIEAKRIMLQRRLFWSKK